MKIAIVGYNTDVDCDIKRSCKDAGIEVEWLLLGPTNPYSCSYMDTDCINPTTQRINEVINMRDIDLYIYKYPFWLEQYPALKAIIDTKPVVAWQTELGPTTNPYAFQASEGFHTVAANNKYEIQKYREQFPNKRILYMPFGCVKWKDSELIPKEKFRSKLVADGTCHYTCGCEGGWKRQSVETIIQPVAHMGLATYGRLPHLDESHEWLSTPWVKYYRGVYECNEYPQVYNTAQVYLGITFNWHLGGFGVKLPRAMSTGIPVIWHKTVGLEQDGFIDRTHYIASSSPAETITFTNMLLQDKSFAKAISSAGKLFVEEHFQYSTLLMNLVRQYYKNL